MKLNDLITLLPLGLAQSEPAVCTVAGISDDQTVLKLHIEKPPDWYLMTLRKRGIFLGAGSDVILFLFKNHEGDWSDNQTLARFSVEEKAEA